MHVNAHPLRLAGAHAAAAPGARAAAKRDATS
jgi:hypothetical protein